MRGMTTTSAIVETIVGEGSDLALSFNVGEVAYTHTCATCGDSDTGRVAQIIAAIAFDHEPYERCLYVPLGIES